MARDGVPYYPLSRSFRGSGLLTALSDSARSRYLSGLIGRGGSGRDQWRHAFERIKM